MAFNLRIENRNLKAVGEATNSQEVAHTTKNLLRAPLIVEFSVECTPQYGNHTSCIAFGAPPRYGWSRQAGAGEPFGAGPRRASRVPEAPSDAGTWIPRPPGISGPSWCLAEGTGLGAGGSVAAAIARGEIRL